MAQAEKEHWAAQLKKLEYEKEVEKLINADELKKSLEKVFIEFKSIRLLPKKYSQQLLDKCLKFINSVLKKKARKKELLAKEKKELMIQVEDLLQKEIDYALKALSEGLKYE